MAESKSDRAERLAREAAQAAWRGLGLDDAGAELLSRVVSAGEHAIDLIAAMYRERACNPKPWWKFHAMMAKSLPRIRWAARWHHRRMARRYEMMYRAGTYIGCKAAA